MRTDRPYRGLDLACPGMDESYCPGPKTSPSLTDIGTTFTAAMRRLGRTAEQIAAGLDALRKASQEPIVLHGAEFYGNWHGMEPVVVEKDEMRHMDDRERALYLRKTRNTGPVDRVGLDGRRR